MKSEVIVNEKTGFFKNHSDALAIIGVNIALAAIMVSMWISNTHRIDSGWQATNARIDNMYQILMSNAGLAIPKDTKQGD